MPGEPLRKIHVRSTGVDEVEQAIQTALGDAQLRPGEHGRVGFSLKAILAPALTASRWAVEGISGGTVEPRASDVPTFVTGIRLGGHYRLWSPTAQVDCDRPFLFPDFTDFDVEQPAGATLAITRAELDTHVQVRTGVANLRVCFLDTAPLDRYRDSAWRSTMAYTARTLETLVDAPDPELAVADLTDHVARVLLTTFPNTAMVIHHDRRYGNAVVRATRFIDEHLATPITITDIAAAAGLSHRGLYAAFEHKLDTSPMQYLKRARLAGAHSDLLHADPASTTVANVAIRWGFVNPTRFTQLYRHEYGQHPRQSLLS